MIDKPDGTFFVLVLLILVSSGCIDEKGSRDDVTIKSIEWGGLNYSIVSYQSMRGGTYKSTDRGAIISLDPNNSYAVFYNVVGDVVEYYFKLNVHAKKEGLRLEVLDENGRKITMLIFNFDETGRKVYVKDKNLEPGENIVYCIFKEENCN